MGEFMNICYHCFQELGPGQIRPGGRCPFCGTPFKHLGDSFKYFGSLPCGSILAGRYIVGYSRGTHFVESYTAFDWQTKKRVIIWEFFPFEHAKRKAGSPYVVYHEAHRVFIDIPERNPDCWLEKYEELNSLAADLSKSGNRDRFPAWLGSFYENNTMYTVMEYVEGETLEEYLTRQGGSVSWPAAMELLATAAEALTEVHQMDAVHGGISPEDIVLARDGTTKLLNTGLYSLWDYYSFSSIDDAWPTNWQPYRFFTIFVRKKSELDVYSLASCFYRAVTGIPPDTPNSYKKRESLPLPEGKEGCFPAAMEAVILEALGPSMRKYSTVEALWQALEAAGGIMK